jgi:rhamnose transport system ATP-binding protein
MMVGRDLSAVFPKRAVPVGDVIVEIRDLHSREKAIRGVSLEVRRGEILGIAGLVGSGRTELAQILFGLARADSGVMRLRGDLIQPRSPAEAIALGIAYVPEDRRQHGVVLQMALTANITLATLKTVSRAGLLDAGKELDVTSDYIGRFRIRTPSVYAEAQTLSGGNQQKVAIARWLAASPDVIILDEPTQGVDVGSKSEIHGLMVDLAARGKAIIMISSELPEILGMSDRIAVMHDGRVAGVLSREEATQPKILSLALGHSPAEQIR